MPAFVTAAARALTIFEIFAHERRELSNAELAKLLQVAESSASDLLYTLVEPGYLVRTERSRRFYPSPRLHALGLSIAENDPVARICNDTLDQLSERTGETAISGNLGSHHVEISGLRQSKHHLRYGPAHILAHGVRIGPAEFAHHLAISDEWRITHDHIRCRPGGFCPVVVS